MARLEDVESMARHGSARAMATSVRHCTDAAIITLTQWNAAALDLLAQQTSDWTAAAPAAQTFAAATEQYRLLGALLQETERNLRIFQDLSHGMEFPTRTGI